MILQTKCNKQKFLVLLAALTAISLILGGAALYKQQAYAQGQAGITSEDPAAPVVQKVGYIRYLNQTAWIRKAPRAGGDQVIKVKKSMQVKVTEASSSGWSKVIYRKKAGYIQTRYLSKYNGYLVAIDAGHQGKGNPAKEPIGPGAKAKKAKVTSGATGQYTKIPEYKLNLKMAKKLEKELKSRGYKVKMIRTTHEVNISNSRRAKIANKAGADVFIRIHANSSASSRVSGALTISPTKKNPYCKGIYADSSRLSKAVLKQFCKATGAKNRGVMYTDTMSGINWSKVPVTIVEMGFLSNKTEDKKMNKSKTYQKKMTKGMADGIDVYFKRR